MIGKLSGLSVVLLVLASSMAVAQTTNVKPGNGGAPAGQYSVVFLDSQQKEAQTGMYEDIEILRRLLSSKLEKLHLLGARERRKEREQIRTEVLNPTVPSLNSLQPNQTLLFNTQEPLNALGFSSVQAPFGSVEGKGSCPLDVEGSYLPGYGIVYTVTLPPPPPKSKPESTKPQSKPLSDWERIRKQLHGEEQPDKDRQAATRAEEPSLTDAILKTLFENGKHFVHLNETEKLTVAVTFRPVEQQRIHLTTTNLDGKPLAASVDPFSSTVTAVTDVTGNTTGSTQVKESSTGSVSKPPTSAQDYLLLGDLHLRQGQANEAINAYRSGLNALSPNAGDNQTLNQLLELHRKLGQAYLSEKDLENVRKEIDLLEKLEKPHAPKREGSAQPVKAQLPSKLMISAPKKLLEQAGAGFISFENFKRNATIEELDFPKLNGASPSSGKK